MLQHETFQCPRPVHALSTLSACSVSDDPALNSEPSPDDSSVHSLHLGRKRLQWLDEHKTGNPHPTPTEMAELERASDTRESESKYSRYQPCQMIHQTISLYLLRLAPKNKAPPSLIALLVVDHQGTRGVSTGRSRQRTGTHDAANTPSKPSFITPDQLQQTE